MAEHTTGQLQQGGQHDLILENRSHLTLTGVQKIIRCDAEGAVIQTGRGTLELSGAGLNVLSLNLERGEAKLSGRVDGIQYTQLRVGGFLSRLMH